MAVYPKTMNAATWLVLGLIVNLTFSPLVRNQDYPGIETSDLESPIETPSQQNMSTVDRAMLQALLDIFQHRYRCFHPLTEQLYGKNCYEFFDRNVGMLLREREFTFEDAEEICQMVDKSLASPRTAEEQRFLADAMISKGWSKAMIGLRFMKQSWKWVGDGTFIRFQGCYENDFIDYTTMHNFFSEQLTTDSCIRFCRRNRRLFAAILADLTCYCSKTHIWRKPASNCSLGCSFASPEQMCDIQTLVFATSGNVFDNWQPSAPSSGGSCAAIQYDCVNNYWADTDCNLTLPFICRFDINNTAVNDGIERVGCSLSVCFQLYSQPELTWADAKSFCRKNGGHLASIESLEQQYLINTLLFHERHLVKQAWIGATNQNWDFTDHTTTPFNGWHRGEVGSNLPNTNTCVSLTVEADGTYGWKTKTCDSLDDVGRRFICSALAPGANFLAFEFDDWENQKTGSTAAPKERTMVWQNATMFCNGEGSVKVTCLYLAILGLFYLDTMML